MDQTGVLKGEQGLAFIDEAYAAITGRPDAKLDSQARIDLYNALESLNPEYEGYSLDDFIRAITSLSAWHKEGRPAAPDPLIEGHSHDK